MIGDDHVYQLRGKSVECPRYKRKFNDLIRMNKFLTPNESNIVAIARGIDRKSYNLLKGCFDFVSKRIIYRTDLKQYGIKEKWAFPIETLTSQQGDCEDTSFLLASLLLAARVKPGNVRVVIGKRDDIGHAWVEAKTDNGWYILESTSDEPLKYGVNTWKILEGYRTGYSPQLYVYRYCCVKS